MENLRPELVSFAEEMESVLKAHDEDRGDSWKTCDIDFLQTRLEDEVQEYKQFEDFSELLDIANFCMMLWWRSREARKSSK